MYKTALQLAEPTPSPTSQKKALCPAAQNARLYGGYCAWAVGQNSLAAIDPNSFSIVDGKLYLNANKRIQERWNKDIPGNIALAEGNWPTLSQQ